MFEHLAMDTAACGLRRRRGVRARLDSSEALVLATARRRTPGRLLRWAVPTRLEVRPGRPWPGVHGYTAYLGVAVLRRHPLSLIQ